MKTNESRNGNLSEGQLGEWLRVANGRLGGYTRAKGRVRREIGNKVSREEAIESGRSSDYSDKGYYYGSK